MFLDLRLLIFIIIDFIKIEITIIFYQGVAALLTQTFVATHV